MSGYQQWETVKKLRKLGYNIEALDYGKFEIWIAWKLIATVRGAGGLFQFYQEVKDK